MIVRVFVLAVAMLLAVVSAELSCVQRGLRKHGNLIPWKGLMSTDPHEPFDERLFSFDFFAHKTPHLDMSLGETERIHDELCSRRNSLQHIMLGDDGDIDLEDTGSIWSRSTTGEDPMPCKDDPGRMCSLGKASCANGYDAGQCPGNWYCCKKARHAGKAAGPDGVLNADNTIAQPSSAPGAKQSWVPVPTTTMSGAISGIKVPIPQVPGLYLGGDLSIDISSGVDMKAVGGRIVVKLGYSIGECINIYIYVALEGSVTGTSITKPGKAKRSVTFGNTFYTTVLYSIYAQAAAVKDAVDGVVRGLTSGLDSANTPTNPSTILNLYAQGFENWYVNVFGDEWSYVTEIGGPKWNNRPSDAVILDALKRIEKMLETTPKQGQDGSLVWEYTASSTWFSTKLLFKLNSDKSWQWSPDNENWMDMKHITVKGGKWDGQKPTDDNIKTIQAIQLIYVDNPGLVAVPGSALAVESEFGCDCDKDPNAFGCATYCSAKKSAGEAWDSTKQAAGAAWDKTKETAGAAWDKTKETAGAAWDKTKEVANNAVDATTNAYNAAKEYVVGELTAASKALIEAAKKTMNSFKAFYERVKADAQRTTVYKLLSKALFKSNAARKPKRVFANLAENMKTEGLQDTDALAERALFVVDAALSGDYTRVIKLKEAIMAFALTNKDQADKVSARIKEVLAHRTVGKAGDPYGSGEMDNGLSADTKDIRMDKVTQEVNAKAGGVKTSTDAANSLYSQLAPELASRFEHIRALAVAQADRLGKLGDPDWASLTPERQSEYSKAFFEIRGLIGDLKTFLKEINAGDGWLKRGVLKGLSFVKEKVDSAMETVKAKTRSMIEADGCGLTLYAGLEIGVGGGFKNPKPPAAGPSVSFNVDLAAVLGWTASMDPLAFADPTKTYSGTFAGGKVVVSGGFAKDAKAKIGVWGSFAQLKPSDTLCKIRYSGTNCMERNGVLSLSFPTNFGLSPEKVRLVFATALGFSVGENEAETNRTADVFKGFLNHLIPGSQGTTPSLDLGDFVREIGSVVRDYALPALVGFGVLPGDNTLKLGISVSYFQADKNGGRVSGYKGFSVIPSLGLDIGLPKEVKDAAAKALMGADISLSMGTAFTYDLTKIFPAITTEKKLQAALQVDAQVDAQVDVEDRSVCEPSRLASRVAELRQSLHYAAQSHKIRSDILKTLGDLERICATDN